jgi:2,4'-dihydroxyacetophenone dioxygenase
VLSRHRHSGAVHAIVLKGRWLYLEHDWVAEQGSYAHEPARETHTLVVPEGVDEMTAWLHQTVYSVESPRPVAGRRRLRLSRLAATRCRRSAPGVNFSSQQNFVTVAGVQQDAASIWFINSRYKKVYLIQSRLLLRITWECRQCIAQ